MTSDALTPWATTMGARVVPSVASGTSKSLGTCGPDSDPTK